ncbi:MAG: helix-turn-helix transcriptional regulator [Bacteriovorax sp.]|nr:helix-turn-helix transcriptional regulator [Bacteriovorax sp.]
MNQNIANIFKSCRKFNKLQQTAMAKTLNITQGTISKIEDATMKIEMELWFKFLEIFKVKDPYCFYYNSFEISTQNSAFLVQEGSPLLPKFKFTDDFLYLEVKMIRPLIDLVQSKHSDEFDLFLKKNNLKKEIIYLLNHPIPLEIIESFFHFLESMKINAKTLMRLNLDFQSTLGETMLNGKAPELSDALNIFNQSNNILDYNFINSNQYAVSTDLTSLNSLKNDSFLMEYCLLLPLLFLKSKINPNIALVEKEIKNNNTWLISFQ